MVLSADVRKSKLAALIDQPGKAVGKLKLFYNDKNETFLVFRIDLDWLIYNRHNGRLEAEMLTWEREHSASPDVYNDELHSLIDDFLWHSNVGRNKHTFEDLKQKEQQRPGIVSLDGVIIDGNRRAMLLRRLGVKYFEAVVLPDAYDENEREIVRLETQYQLGEDPTLEYGPLQKYLHAKRLKEHLGISEPDIAKLMGFFGKSGDGAVKKLLRIMALMDEYLDHIGCSGLYTMLKEADGSTKEGMFVDLDADLNRFPTGAQWDPDPDIDIPELKTIQFDHIRFGGDFSDTTKKYRSISHEGSGRKSFFAHKDIWEGFRDEHRREIDPVTIGLASLSEYQAKHGHKSAVDAARARDSEWREKVKSAIKRNFGLSSERLSAKVEVIEPRRLLERAKNALERIDIESDGFTKEPANVPLVKEINHITYEMKRRLERVGR